MIGRRASRPRPLLGLLTAFWGLASASPALGQAAIRDFDRPFVVLDTGGHTAPVRSLLFDGNDRLLSGGMDKVVQAWKFADGRPALASVIRPPAWRGPAGVIYAMALSPTKDAKGRRTLAVAGIGLASTRGNITLFADPGDPAKPNGEILAVLPAKFPKEPDSPGHSETVMSLAFSPDGRLLASTGNDGRVLLWDVATRKQVAVLHGPGPAINAISFRPDGKRLAGGGDDGDLHVWDVERRVSLGARRRAHNEEVVSGDTAGRQILCLAYDPAGGQFVVLGREDGQIVRYDGDLLDRATRLQPSGSVLGMVESLTISPDGKTLAAAVVEHPIKEHGVRPRVDCLIQLRSLPDGRLLERSFRTNNLVYALAFSPDGKRLAVAGGDEQAVAVHALDRQDLPPLELKGTGASVWRVGFDKDSRTVGFSRAQEHAGQAVEYIGYNLKTHEIVPAPSAPVQRAIKEWEGWSVQPVDPYNLNVFGPDRRFRFPVKLDWKSDHRWWAWSFLPKGPKHDKPALAVACDAGVAIYRLEDGVRTRFLNGHSGIVYDVAPSPDGMWLVTGSADQTVRLWSLAGCDTLPPLGAKFQKRADGRIEVASVEKLGFADAMGLKAGDVVEILAVNSQQRFSLDEVTTLDTLPPGTRIELQVRRGNDAVQVGTTRRDSPRMSLFVGGDREWVVWTPEGYYETSVQGDRKYLGWHRNGKNLDLPTDRFPAETFEKELRRPDVLTALIDNDNPAQAFAPVQNQNPDPSAIVAAQAPPVVNLTTNLPRAPEAPIVAPAGANVTVGAQIAAEGRSPIASARVLVDGRPIGAPTTFDPPQDAARISVPIDPHAGEQTVAVEVTNRDGKTRIVAADLVVNATAPKAPTLHVLAIAASGKFRDPRYPEIRYAARDAADLRAFFAAPDKIRRFDNLDDPPPIVGSEATGKTLRQTFHALTEQVQDPNDTLVVVLETHILTGAKDRFVIANDSSAQPTTEDTPTAEEIGNALADVAKRGCRVLLLLDSAHERGPAESRSGLVDYVRSLTRRNVIVFVAANHGVSERITQLQHGAFAAAILEVFNARAKSRAWVKPKSPMTLDDFRDAVESRVQELTVRKQFAACYIPPTLSSKVPIFEPNTPRNLAEAK